MGLAEVYRTAAPEPTRAHVHSHLGQQQHLLGDLEGKLGSVSLHRSQCHRGQRGVPGHREIGEGSGQPHVHGGHSGQFVGKDIGTHPPFHQTGQGHQSDAIGLDAPVGNPPRHAEAAFPAHRCLGQGEAPGNHGQGVVRVEGHQHTPFGGHVPLTGPDIYDGGAQGVSEIRPVPGEFGVDAAPSRQPGAVHADALQQPCQIHPSPDGGDPVSPGGAQVLQGVRPLDPAAGPPGLRQRGFQTLRRDMDFSREAGEGNSLHLKPCNRDPAIDFEVAPGGYQFPLHLRLPRQVGMNAHRAIQDLQVHLCAPGTVQPGPDPGARPVKAISRPGRPHPAQVPTIPVPAQPGP